MTAILIAIFSPILFGVYLLVRREFQDRKKLLAAAGAFLLLTAGAAVPVLLSERQKLYPLFDLTAQLSIELRVDEIGVLFAGMTAVIFLCAGFFSFAYMKHERNERRYYGYYLLVWGVLYGLCFAGNLITLYLFFELLTLCSMPLVLHSGSHEAVMAGLKYLFYSLCGAYMALFGVYFVARYGETLRFTAGGVLGAEAAGHTGILLIAAFLMLVGFGVKAGMFPLHAWLTAAHPAAPAPASAVLSAVIAKGGVLAIVRVVYYIFGTAFLRGTWVQTTWLVLTLVTVFMGSMLAYREDVLKKRLAYSTISQVSYILFGLAVMDGVSVTGGLLHVLGHGFIKAGLFLCAGAIIFQTGRTRASELRGIGKEMPVLLWCYTILSLGLIGIPPTGGFVSKWYLALGALESGIPGFSWIGPAVLLVSALLTAGYLLPISIRGFLPGDDYDYRALQRREPSLLMNLPILLLTALSVILGLLPGGLIAGLTGLAGKIADF